MTRFLQISIVLLLVLSSGFAVPWHVSLDHGHGLTHVDGRLVIVHTHEREAPKPSGTVSVADGHDSDPHHHDLHATAGPGSGICRSHAAGVPMVFAALQLAIAVFAVPPLTTVIDAQAFPPPKRFSDKQSPLRGPPVC